MGLKGYDIDVAACREVLARVESDSADIDLERAALGAELEAAMAACRSQQIGTALLDLWNQVLALQCEAVSTRVENAVGGVGMAINAYVLGDSQMADDGRRQVAELPELVIEDAKAST